MDFVYEYFDKYYYSEDEEEKLRIIEDFFEKLWSHYPKLRTFKYKEEYTFRPPHRDDDSFTFLKAYINFLYMKHCSDRVMLRYKKVEYDVDYYRKIIFVYMKKIFKSYMPSEIYYQKNEVTSIDNYYDGFGDDSYVCSYICKKLKGYMKNRVANYYKTGWYGDCECGAQFRKKRINSAKKRCDDCALKEKYAQTVQSKRRTRVGRYKRWRALPMPEVYGEQTDNLQ